MDACMADSEGNATSSKQQKVCTPCICWHSNQPCECTRTLCKTLQNAGTMGLLPALLVDRHDCVSSRVWMNYVDQSLLISTYYCEVQRSRSVVIHHVISTRWCPTMCRSDNRTLTCGADRLVARDKAGIKWYLGLRVLWKPLSHSSQGSPKLWVIFCTLALLPSYALLWSLGQSVTA